MTPQTVDGPALSLSDVVGPFIGTMSAALLAYVFARRAWRAQERRKVYAEFVHALSRFVDSSAWWTGTYGSEPSKPHVAEVQRMREALDHLLVAMRDVALVGSEILAAAVRRLVRDAQVIVDWAGADTSEILKRTADGQTLPVIGWDRVDAVIRIARAEIGTDSAFGKMFAWLFIRIVDKQGRRRARS